MRKQRMPDETRVQRDLSARAGSFLAVWGAPLIAGLIASVAAWRRACGGPFLLLIGAILLMNVHLILVPALGVAALAR